MNRKQRGMTMVSFLMVVIVVGFALYIGMKLFPMYQEFFAVKASMKSVAQDPDSADEGKAMQLLFKKLDMSYSDSVKRENVRFEHSGSGTRMIVSYEVRRPLVGNLDIVGNFENAQDMASN